MHTLLYLNIKEGISYLNLWWGIALSLEIFLPQTNSIILTFSLRHILHFPIHSKVLYSYHLKQIKYSMRKLFSKLADGLSQYFIVNRRSNILDIFRKQHIGHILSPEDTSPITITTGLSLQHCGSSAKIWYS